MNQSLILLLLFLIAKLKKVKKKKKRGEGESLDEGHPYVTKIFAKFSHDAPLPMVKKKHLTTEQLNARRRKVWLTIAKKEIPKVSVVRRRKKMSHIFGEKLSTIIFRLWCLIMLFLHILQSFKQKTSAKNLVLTNAKKVKHFTPLCCLRQDWIVQD